MIDTHCHILPGVDDGAKSLDEALSMTEMALSGGITTIVATPHTMVPGFPDAPSLQRIAREQLAEALWKRSIPLTIVSGCEFALHPESFGKLSAEHCINGGPAVLLELPWEAAADASEDFLLQLKSRGFHPLVAHVERHPRVLLHDLKRWHAAGIHLQVTAPSILGMWGMEAKLRAESILTQGLAFALASDAHDLTGRPPALLPALRMVAERIGQDAAEKLVDGNPRSLLSPQAS